MQDNMGVPASPSGSQASPGAADASPPSVSIPNAAAVPLQIVAIPYFRNLRGGDMVFGATLSWRVGASREEAIGIAVEYAHSQEPGSTFGTPLTETIILAAQAIEARRAATAKTDAVEDESAVPKGCAQ